MTGMTSEPNGTTSHRNVVVLGATRGMGRALARQLVARGDRVCLLGRDPGDVASSVADLAARASPGTPAPIGVLCDLAATDRFAAVLDEAWAALGRVDAVIVTAGAFAPMAVLDQDLQKAQELLHLNFTCTIVFCEHVRGRLLAAGGGTLVVFGSVAGDRGRKPVGVYGASKAGLAAYLEALDHRFASDGLHVVTVKPGFVRTAMTAGLPEPPFAGEPDDVAKRVLAAMDRGSPVVYAPAIWGLVMFAIRLLPRFVMRRVGF
jgi:decaprenylphospho-beta-D-erythro-pentofuranosid-2-ulose 2-reductase